MSETKDSRLACAKSPRGVGIAARSIAYCVRHTESESRVGSEVLRIPVAFRLSKDHRPKYILNHWLHQAPGKDGTVRPIDPISALSKNNPSFGHAP